MSSGLLWFDSKSPLSQIIADAAKRYKEKYGYMPDTAFVNSDTPRETLAALQAEYAPKNIAVKASRHVMPKYVWLGVSAAREPVNQ